MENHPHESQKIEGVLILKKLIKKLVICIMNQIINQNKSNKIKLDFKDSKYATGTKKKIYC